MQQSSKEELDELQKRKKEDEGVMEEAIFVLWKVKGYMRWIFEETRGKELAPPKVSPPPSFTPPLSYKGGRTWVGVRQ